MNAGFTPRLIRVDPCSCVSHFLQHGFDDVGDAGDSGVELGRVLAAGRQSSAPGAKDDDVAHFEMSWSTGGAFPFAASHASRSATVDARPRFVLEMHDSESNQRCTP